MENAIPTQTHPDPMKLLLQLLSFFLPWALRRKVLGRLYGFALAETSRIGFSIFLCKGMVLHEGASIGHLNVVKGLARLDLGAHSSIGNLNWITGFPQIDSPHFAAEPDRVPELIVGKHSAITQRHLIDCTNRVEIGHHTTFAGFRSQILTHTIDLVENRQSSKPVRIGDYCFIGTECVLLGGAELPSWSVLGAKSLLNKAMTTEWRLYGGVPAKELSEIPRDAKYFSREKGFVV